MKTLYHIVFLFSLMLSSAAFAQPAAYTQPLFDQLQKQGKPVLVEVHADWCSTCRAQAPVVDSLLKQKEFQAITPLRVDYDEQKDIVKALNVRKQSTLLLFKDGKEVARSTGDTSSRSIELLLQKAL